MGTIIREVSEPINRKDLNRIYKINWFLGKFLDFEFYNSNNFKRNLDISILTLFVFNFWKFRLIKLFQKARIILYYSKSNDPVSSHEFSSIIRKKKIQYWHLYIDTLLFENLRSPNYPKKRNNHENRSF